MRQFSDRPTKKTIRKLLAAEGYLELDLPQRAILELDQIENAGELSPYLSYLRGQAHRGLEDFGQAIDFLQEAASTMPAPLIGRVWEDLSDCFRREGLEELAEIAEMFAGDPAGGADRNLSELSFQDFLFDENEESSDDFGPDDWNRSSIFSADDFEDFNFEEEWEAKEESHRNPPRK